MGVVQQAAATATPDGHYGAYTMLDWTATLTEVAQVYASKKTIGMRPHCLGVIT